MHNTSTYSNANSHEGIISRQCYLASSQVPWVEVSLCSSCWVPDPNAACASYGKKKKKGAVFHGLDKEVTMGTRTALSVVLVKSLKTHPSLALLCTCMEMGIDKACQTRENGAKGKRPILQSHMAYTAEGSVGPIQEGKYLFSYLLGNIEVILKTVLYKEKI